MKRLFLLLLIAAMTMVTAVPAARAFDKDPWHVVDKTLRQLDVRMEAVLADRDRFGADPRMRDQIARLRFGISDLTANVQSRTGDPTVARKSADNLSDLMAQVETEYHVRIHDRVVVRVY